MSRFQGSARRSWERWVTERNSDPAADPTETRDARPFLTSASVAVSESGGGGGAQKAVAVTVYRAAPGAETGVDWAGIDNAEARPKRSVGELVEHGHDAILVTEHWGRGPLADVAPANGSQDTHPHLVGATGCGLVTTATGTGIAERSFAGVEDVAVGCIGDLPSQVAVVLFDANDDGPEQLDGLEGEVEDFEFHHGLLLF